MMVSNLRNALQNAGAKVSAPVTAASPAHAELPKEAVRAAPAQSSRRDTVALTVHFPEAVRRQLKILSSEQGRNMDDMVAEALNLLFAAYRKPEIAPRKSIK